MKKGIGTAVIFVIVISINMQPVFAEIFFPTTNFRLQGPPTYCIILPNESISEQQKLQWASLVETTILDWEEKLKEKETVNDELWDISIEITSEESENCGISIYFKDKPSLSGTVAGFFTWPPGSITVYYLQLELCGLFTCYDDETFISDDAMSAIALHEVGHSFGLDHYVSDDIDTNSKWQTSNKTPPSIMIPTIHNNPNLQEITDMDVNKVREIYGSDGFYAFSSIPIPEPILEPTPDPIPIPDPTPIPEPIPEIIEPIIPDRPFTSMSISEKIIEVQNQQQQEIKVSGKVADDKLLRGHPVIITLYKPDQSIQILKTSVTSDGVFQMLLIFDKNSIRGSYQVSASYIEHVDKDKDVYFEIVDKIDTSSHDEGNGKTEPITESEPTASSQMEKKSDSIIPQWVKNNARWWSEGSIDDETFVGAMEFLIASKIIDAVENEGTQAVHEIPEWVKTDARWWSEGSIDDETFVGAMEFLIKIGIIKTS